MICDFPKWWAFLRYDGFNFFAEERIRVGEEEAGTSASNQAYDKFQVKQDKAQTIQLLDLVRRKVHGRINPWQLIMVISTAIQKNSAKVWTDYFVAVNLHPHHRMTFPDWIKKISPAVKTGDTAYFLTMKVHTMMPCHLFGKRCMYLFKDRQCVLLIAFFREAPPGESPWTKENVMSIVRFFSLDEIPKIKICHMGL